MYVTLGYNFIKCIFFILTECASVNYISISVSLGIHLILLQSAKEIGKTMENNHRTKKGQ